MTTGTTNIETPYKGGEAKVLPAYIDHNGHMNVGYYHVVFDIASDPFFDWLGLNGAYRKANHASTFALESHLHFVREVKEGDRLRFEARLLDVDHKRIHFYQEMFHADEGYLAATYESISAHVDMRVRRTAPMPESLLSRLREIAAAHARLERPWQVGHVISIKPPAR
ncbi:MAG: thioesterase family protein [Burkholderiaceae bacterium]